MGYYLNTGEPYPEGFERIGLEQNHLAIDALAHDDEWHEGVHKARKHFKKIRALYRLIRDEIGEKAYWDGNAFYRKAAGELEGLRDISARIETVDFLRTAYNEVVRETTFSHLQALLEEERQRLAAQHINESGRISEVVQQLQTARSRYAELPIRAGCQKNLLKGLHRVYERGYEGYYLIRRRPPSVEQMHEWRKRVKYLWYHHRLLHKAWPHVLNGYRKHLKQLSTFLGDYHDLALLQQKVESLAGRLPEDAGSLLKALAQEQQLKLLKECRIAGQRLYAEKPKAFTRRMEEILNAWRQ